MIFAPSCDVTHSRHYTSPRPAAYDLRRYQRVTGFPGLVRYLCEDCARGHISPRFQATFRIARTGGPPK
jgi:hypothetical protein